MGHVPLTLTVVTGSAVDKQKGGTKPRLGILRFYFFKKLFSGFFEDLPFGFIFQIEETRKMMTKNCQYFALLLSEEAFDVSC